jgi:hypothetical protein
MKKQNLTDDKLDQLQTLVHELCQKKPNRTKLKTLAEKLGCASFETNEDLMEKILLTYPSMIKNAKSRKNTESELA